MRLPCSRSAQEEGFFPVASNHRPGSGSNKFCMAVLG